MIQNRGLSKLLSCGFCFKDIGKTSQVRFDDSEVLEIEVEKVEAWLSKCLLKLLGQSENLSMPLTEVLSKVCWCLSLLSFQQLVVVLGMKQLIFMVCFQVQTSVNSALQQLQKRAYIEGDDFYTGERVCHLCKKIVDSTNCNLLKCDNCNDRLTVNLASLHRKILLM